MCLLSAGAAQCRQSAVEAGWRRHATLRHATPCRAAPHNVTTRRAAPRQGRADDRRRRAPSPLFFFFHLPFPLAAGRVHAGRRATSSVASKILAFHRPRGPRCAARASSQRHARTRERERDRERSGEGRISPLESRLARKSRENLPTTRCDPRPPLPLSFSSCKR